MSLAPFAVAGGRAGGCTHGEKLGGDLLAEHGALGGCWQLWDRSRAARTGPVPGEGCGYLAVQTTAVCCRM